MVEWLPGNFWLQGQCSAATDCLKKQKMSNENKTHDYPLPLLYSC